jgi:hypothetical protein
MKSIAELLALSRQELHQYLGGNFETFQEIFCELPESHDLLKDRILLFMLFNNLARCEWLKEVSREHKKDEFFYIFANETYNALDTERHARPINTSELPSISVKTFPSFSEGSRSAPNVEKVDWSPVQKVQSRSLSADTVVAATPATQTKPPSSPLISVK